MASVTNSASQTLSTNDLRSHGVESKRNYEHRHKWQYGQVKGPGRGEAAHGVPAKHEAVPEREFYKRENTFNFRKQTKHTRGPVVPSVDDLTYGDASASDSPSDTEDAADTTAVAPDAEITYSFDHPRGASHGSQILSSALDKAVAQFENAVTDKIVREEYEVLNQDGEAASGSATVVKGRKGKIPALAAGMISPRDEAEYEFV